MKSLIALAIAVPFLTPSIAHAYAVETQDPLHKLSRNRKSCSWLLQRNQVFGLLEE